MERLRLAAIPKNEAQANSGNALDVDAVADKLETEIETDPNRFDVKLVKSVLDTNISLPNGIRGKVGGIIADTAPNMYADMLEAVVNIRQDYFYQTHASEGDQPEDPEALQIVLETVSRNDIERGLGYKRIIDRAKNGRYNGHTGIMMGKALYVVGNLFKTASEHYKEMGGNTSEVRPKTPSPEKLFLYIDPTETA